MKRRPAKKKKVSRKNLNSLRSRTAADLMSTPLVTARVHESMEQVAALFTEKKVSSVAVLNELDEPVGVLTTTDLAWFARNNAVHSINEVAGTSPMHSALERTIGTISPWMSRRVYAVAPDATLKEVVTQMRKHHLHHLFVKGEHGKGLQGIVTTTDLVRELSSFL
jgi:CBS domain-containing protein